jgi:hypothetical protein
MMHSQKSTQFSVLFRRDYQSFQGGHLKVYDYVNHVDSADWLSSSIYIDPTSKKDHLWLNHPNLVHKYEPLGADILFLAGTDWRALNSFPNIEEDIPVFNLIQGVGHANPSLELYSYLSRKAIRICVSNEVAEAIRETGLCNGPIYTITNCIDLDLIAETKRNAFQAVKVLIAGIKQPVLANELLHRLLARNIKAECLDKRTDRASYLQKINNSYVIVTLPLQSEGFYLPALEAMAMGKPLVCPDCIGNRSFCFDGINCLMPQLNIDSLESAVLSLLTNTDLANSLAANALSQSLDHDIHKERSLFLELLKNVCDNL